MTRITEYGRAADRDRYVVWLDAVPWAGIPGTGRRVAREMTRHAPVLWVDPPVSPLTSADRLGNRGRRALPSLDVIDDQIIQLSPVALPGFTRPGIRASTAPLVRAQLRWALRGTGIRPRAVVATHLDDVLGRWDNAVNVLYATDDYVAGAELMGLSADWLRAQERRALARADVVAVTSPLLAERWSALGAEPVLIPNGCAAAEVGDDQVTAADVGLPRPVVGLAGLLSERIDMRILEAIADAGFSLLMIGPHDARWQSERFGALTSRPCVRYIGWVPADEMPPYLAAMDVGITPYADTPFNRASFPIKTLDYLASGKPVVTTSLPAAKWLRDDFREANESEAGGVLTLADGSAEFVTALRCAVGEPTERTDCPVLAGGRNRIDEACRMFAARHSWARRADTLAAAIGI